MIYVFFCYGLAFFSMGLAILLIPRRGSAFSFAHNLWLIAAFGILHGLNEWLDMFLLIEGPAAHTLLRAARTLLLPVSFLFLVQFFVQSAPAAGRRKAALRGLPWLLFALWAGVAAMSRRPFVDCDIAARYLLAAPGSFLTCWVLARQAGQFREMRLRTVSSRLAVAAGAFLLYGLFAALIVPEADFLPASAFNYREFLDHLSVPVQVFRTLCAAVIAVSMAGVLSLFDYQTQELIRDSACRDPLTGLPNRLLLTTRIAQAVAHARQFRHLVAVMMLDLDGFKRVNDTRGHGAGDNLLVCAAGRLAGLVRRSDTVARLGGDEFVVVLPDTAREDEALRVGGKIVEEFRKPFPCEGGEIRITASIGVALYPRDGSDAARLLKSADAAMYRAKGTGRDACRSLNGPRDLPGAGPGPGPGTP